MVYTGVSREKVYKTLVTSMGKMQSEPQKYVPPHPPVVDTIGTVGSGTASYEVALACDSGNNSECDCSSSNTMATALDLGFNTWVGGNICCAGDAVWYKFVADAVGAHSNGGVGSYTITTRGSLDTMGYLYDANGTLIASNDDCNGLNFGITANLAYKATYYVRVKAYSSNVGSYSVNLSFAPASGNSGTTETTPAVCYSPNRMYMSFYTETWGSNTIQSLYDNEDAVCGIIYNNKPFYFQKNLLGDIIGIVDENAYVVSEDER